MAIGEIFVDGDIIAHLPIAGVLDGGQPVLHHEGDGGGGDVVVVGPLLVQPGHRDLGLLEWRRSNCLAHIQPCQGRVDGHGEVLRVLCVACLTLVLGAVCQGACPRLSGVGSRPHGLLSSL